jgi:hypothetical protein
VPHLRKRLFALIIIALMVIGLTFESNNNIVKAQSGTNESGIISQDTTWTPSSSPYTLTGNTLVQQGVTLTIQPGVTVNLGSYYIMVNGTLTVKGSSNNPVNFNKGSITFTSYSTNWNEQSLSGNIIDNANLTSTPIFINGTSPKISNSYTSSITVNGGSPNISNNNINGEIEVVAGSPTISHNQIKTTTINVGSVFSQLTVYQPVSAISVNGSPLISDNVITGGGEITDNYGRLQGAVPAIQVNDGLPTISDNIIHGEMGGSLVAYSSCTISNNILYGGVGIESGSSTIAHNDINGEVNAEGNGLITIANNKIDRIRFGSCSSVISNNILVYGGIEYGVDYGWGTPAVSEVISGNVISNCPDYPGAINIQTLGSVTINGNIIANSAYAGINIKQSSNLTIQNNNILNNNGTGISIDNSPASNINFNNIQSNKQSSIYLKSPNNVNATYNWWGTTDTQAISQTIYDYYKDFNLGTVTFIPLLTSQNPSAPTQDYTPTAGSTLIPQPTPTLTPTPNPTLASATPTPTTPEFALNPHCDCNYAYVWNIGNFDGKAKTGTMNICGSMGLSEFNTL